MSDEPAERKFICPECGGTTPGERLEVNPPEKDRSPWRNAFSRTVCAECGRTIPTALAERWHIDSIEEARRIWREEFRDRPEPGKRSGCWYGAVGAGAGGCLLPAVLFFLVVTSGDIGGFLFWPMVSVTLGLIGLALGFGFHAVFRSTKNK